MNLIERVLAWDERQDPAAAPDKPELPRRKLGMHERLVMEQLADGEWVDEVVLRKQLRWSRVRFFVTTVLMVRAGWIEARQPEGGSFWRSEYRVTPEVW